MFFTISPLYLLPVNNEKADSEVKKVVVRLGTFHLQMSFLGAIGHLMAGSGLQEVVELVYAPNAVSHMLTGKAYARAVRAHLLVDAALNAIVAAEAFQTPQILFQCDTDEANSERRHFEPSLNIDEQNSETGGQSLSSLEIDFGENASMLPTHFWKM